MKWVNLKEVCGEAESNSSFDILDQNAFIVPFEVGEIEFHKREEIREIKLLVRLEMLRLRHPHVAIFLVACGYMTKANAEEDALDTILRTIRRHLRTDQKGSCTEIECQGYTAVGISVEEYLEISEYFWGRPTVVGRFHGDDFE